MRHIRVTKGCLEAIMMLGQRVVGSLHKISARDMMRFAMQKISGYENKNLFRAYKAITEIGKSTEWIYVDDEIYEYMRTISEDFARDYNAKLKASICAEIIVRTALAPDEVRTFSLNLHGYKALRDDYSERIRKAAGEANTVTPDAIMVQEMRIGEKNEFLNEFMAALEDNYVPVFPYKMDPAADAEHCICMTFVRKELPFRAYYLEGWDQNPELRLRYNMVGIGNDQYVNCWIPHTSKDSDKVRMDATRLMWRTLGKMASDYRDSECGFYVVGDLNAYNGSLFGKELRSLKEVMFDLKPPKIRYRKTCRRNVLDYAFSNLAAHRMREIKATIYEPSTVKSKISDHEALVIKSVAAG